MALRRYTFKLYPNAPQDAALRQQARLCAILWNALLEMRETHYRRAKQRGDRKTSLSAFDQGKDLTALNAAAKSDPDLAEWRSIPRGTQERVADMLDLAMKAFFKRAKAGAGASSGYPQFKSVYAITNFHKAFPTPCSIPMREPAKSGWRLENTVDSPPARKSEPKSDAESLRARGEEGRTLETPSPRAPAGGWRLTLRGIPDAIKARGKFPVEPTAFKTADVKFYDGSWWLSVCVELPERRVKGAPRVADAARKRGQADRGRKSAGAGKDRIWRVMNRPAHLRFVRRLPCCICHTSPVEAAHIRYNDAAAGKMQAIGKKPDDKWTLPLCAGHHRELPGAQHSMNERKFWERHGIDPLRLADLLFVISGDLSRGETLILEARRVAGRF